MNNQTVDKSKNKLAEWLDSRFRIPGTDIRFGLDLLIGLIPGVGDWITAMIAVYIPVSAIKEGASPAVIFRMFLNIIFDLLIGIVPVIGDLFDLSWRSNLKNAKLLQKIVDEPGKTEAKSRLLVWSITLFLIGLVVAILFAIGWLVNEIWQLIF